MTQPAERRLLTEAARDLHETTELPKKFIPTSRGYIQEPIDLNTLRDSENVGPFHSQVSNLINGPAEAAPSRMALVEVFRTTGWGSTSTQRVTTADGVWTRAALNASTWHPWKPVGSSQARGTLPDGTDLNDVQGAEWSGTWMISPSRAYENLPATSTVTTTLIVNAGNDINSTVQWLVISNPTRGEVYYRDFRQFQSGTGLPLWPAWRRLANADEISDLAGSGIEYDDDGVPYVAEGAGPNPQPASRRLVTEDRAPGFVNATSVTSSTIRRLVASTDSGTPLLNGDLLFVYV